LRLRLGAHRRQDHAKRNDPQDLTHQSLHPRAMFAISGRRRLRRGIATVAA
jgi:hypothetical protein